MTWATGLAGCLDALELVVTRGRYSELSLALPSGDSRLSLLDAGALPHGDGEVAVGGYRVVYKATVADSRRATRRFATVLAVEPEPPFAVMVRVYKEPGLAMAKFDVMWRGCVRDRPRVLRLAIGDAYELDAAVKIGGETYALRRP